MKKTFIAGFAILLPIAVTLFIVGFIVDFLTTPFMGTVEMIATHFGSQEFADTHHTLFVFLCRITVLIGIFLFIFLLGFLGRRIFFRFFILFTQKLFSKIPIIKTIYRITKEISTRLLSSDKKTLFKATVAVPFPHEKTRVLGLLSGDAPKVVQAKKEGLKSIFIPTAPHPISGFLVMYQEDEVQKTPVETEDLFKFLLSCGLFHPGEKKP